ncbi:MAG: iron-containing alcohol dehydrogenase [Oscillospiraceae bacterium]|jgi:alcohol dehydrogenase|nr:iron-containing alcohol dehydrogenase [Oscillospiraceae bacterium]
MSQWQWSLPTRVIFGPGARACLPEFIAGKRAALVRSRSAGSVPGDYAGEFSGIRPNPTVENVRDCAAFLSAMGAEIVVAVGGGSVLDCAKAAAKALPLIALPTTAGTGSEVTNISVVSDDAVHTKTPQMSPDYFPAIAIVDPELTYTMPRRVAAESGVDALSHAIEALWSIHHNPASDALALRACRLIFDHLAPSCEGGLASRDAMSEGSLLAGLAFAQTRTAGVHASSFPLTARYGLSHGAACGFTLAAFARLNGIDSHARALGFADSAALADEIDRIKKALGLPVYLADAGIAEPDLPQLARDCLQPPNMRNNPVAMDEAGMLRLLLSLK